MKYWRVLPLLLLCGCPINPDTRYFAKKKPRNEDLAGMYVPNARTRGWVRQAGKYPDRETYIVLSQDGSFQMVNMPDWWRTSFGEPNGQFDSGAGEWQSVKVQEWWELQLVFRSRKQFTSDPHDSGLATLFPLLDNRRHTVCGSTSEIWMAVG